MFNKKGKDGTNSGEEKNGSVVPKRTAEKLMTSEAIVKAKTCENIPSGEWNNDQLWEVPLEFTMNIGKEKK